MGIDIPVPIFVHNGSRRDYGKWLSCRYMRNRKKEEGMEASSKAPPDDFTGSICLALFNHLPILVFTLDRQCRLHWSNKFIFQMLGYELYEIKGMPEGFASLINPSDREVFKKKLKDAFESREKRFFSFDTTLYHKDRFPIHVHLRSYFFCNSKGTSGRPFLYFYASNETEKVLLSRCAERDKRLITIGTMTAEIVHEIKNAIIAVGGLAMLAKRRYPDCRELEIIQSEAYRLERLTKSINSFVRPGKIKGMQSDALSILKKSLCLLSPEIKKRNIKIDLSLCREMKELEVDSDALMEVFVNLIRNAMEALKPGGRLTIRCHRKDGNIAIDFKNRMETKCVEDRENIFKPIDQGGRSIGLPISHKIIEDQGGQLFFRQIGDHALFSITFPFPFSESVCGGKEMEPESRGL